MTATSYTILLDLVAALMLLWGFLCSPQCKLNKSVFLVKLQSHWSRTTHSISTAMDFMWAKMEAVNTKGISWMWFGIFCFTAPLHCYLAAEQRTRGCHFAWHQQRHWADSVSAGRSQVERGLFLWDWELVIRQQYRGRNKKGEMFCNRTVFLLPKLQIIASNMFFVWSSFRPTT